MLRWDDPDFAKIKRVLETWLAASAYLDPTEYERVWHAYAGIVDTLQSRFADVAESGIRRNDLFAEWARQVRCSLPSPFDEQLTLIPFAVELTTGCSAGCWYCGVRAPALHQVPALEEAELRGLLIECKEAFGDNGRSGILYWATDPFDHPQYERAAEIFFEVFGIFPYFTSVVAAKQVERLESFLNRTKSHKCRGMRISIKNDRDLLNMFRRLSPTQTSNVIFDFKTKRSLNAIMNVGRAADTFVRNPRLYASEVIKRQKYHGIQSVKLGAETISCVTGVLVNLTSKIIRVVEPSCGQGDFTGFQVLSEGQLGRDRIANLIPKGRFATS